MSIIQIAAMSENRVIGRDNALPWHIPEDLKFFKTQTSGRPCIFGRKTFEAVGRVLPNRLSVVVSRQSNYQLPKPPPELQAELRLTDTLERAVELCQEPRIASRYGEDIYICGGGEIFKQALSITDVILLTLIHREVEGDAFFPPFEDSGFRLIERLDRVEPEPFSFLRYERVQ